MTTSHSAHARNRTPAGVPAGGQFAAERKAEAGASTLTPSARPLPQDEFRPRGPEDVRIDERTGRAHVLDPYGRDLQLIVEQWHRVDDEKDLVVREVFDPNDFATDGTLAAQALAEANRHIRDLPRPATDVVTAQAVLDRAIDLPESVVAEARTFFDPEDAEFALTGIHDYNANPGCERGVLASFGISREPLAAVGRAEVFDEAVASLRAHGSLTPDQFEHLESTHGRADYSAPIVRAQMENPDVQALTSQNWVVGDDERLVCLDEWAARHHRLAAAETAVDEALEAAPEDILDQPVIDQLESLGLDTDDGEVNAVEASNLVADAQEECRTRVRDLVTSILMGDRR
jgi:hypothetical protein